MTDREKVIKGLEELEGFLFKEYTNIKAEESKIYYDRFKSLSDALSLLKEQEAVRWIPVTEKLPKSMANKVIVYLQHDELVPEIGYGHYEKYKGVEMWYNLETNEQFSKRGYTVTHWTPMPKSPEGEKLVLY